MKAIKYGHRTICDKYGQVGYPWKELQKCSSAVVTRWVLKFFSGAHMTYWHRWLEGLSSIKKKIGTPWGTVLIQPHTIPALLAPSQKYVKTWPGDYSALQWRAPLELSASPADLKVCRVGWAPDYRFVRFWLFKSKYEVVLIRGCDYILQLGKTMLYILCHLVLPACTLTGTFSTWSLGVSWVWQRSRRRTGVLWG